MLARAGPNPTKIWNDQSKPATKAMYITAQQLRRDSLWDLAIVLWGTVDKRALVYNKWDIRHTV